MLIDTSPALAPRPAPAHLSEAAAALRHARTTRRPIPPISRSFGVRGLEQAYQVAAINHGLRLAEGRRVVGRKIGLTARAVQAQLGVNQPDFGLLFDDMELLNGDCVPARLLIQPKVEAEVAFVMGRDLGAQPPSWAEFLGAVAYALPAIEIVDSAIENWQITLEDTVADNASSALYVLGDQPVALGTLDLATCGMQLTRNGRVAAVGAGAACLDHPLRAAYWLARAMAEHGHGVAQGEVILSGALGPMVAVAPGDQIEVRMGSLGAVSCRIGMEEQA